jgi:hypothetical protein
MPPKKATTGGGGERGQIGGDANLKQKSPAEFFQDNKGIAGFENAGKSLYTTLREFIENALDAAEHIGVLPQVDVLVEEVTLTQYETMIGLDAHVRKDDTLYDDFETEKARAKRLEREAKVEMQLEKAAAANANKGKKGGGLRCFFANTSFHIHQSRKSVVSRVFYSNKTQTIPRKVFDGTIGKGSPGWGAPPGSAIV